MTDPTPQPPSAPQIDARAEPRVSVAWRGMMLLPDKRAFEVRIKDISDSGLGIVAPQAVPNFTVVNVAVMVPDLIDATRSVTVRGKFRTAYVVIHGHDYRVGGVWNELDKASAELLKQHVRRHRYAGS